MSIKIYVITHKKIDLKLPTNYQKLLVGSYKTECLEKDYVLDDSSEDNISKKNRNYCELTGLYWIWKNDQNDIKGLVHYRRFFSWNRFTNKIWCFYTENIIKKILRDYDIIVAEKLFIDEKTVKDDYLVNHKKEDWEKLKYIILKDYPQYLSAFEKIENGNWFFPYNMIIAKTDMFNQYAAWIFDVLGKLENIVDLTSYDVQQARIYGFLSERLLAVWLLANHYMVYEAPVIQIDCRFRYRIRRILEKWFQRKVNLGRK